MRKNKPNVWRSNMKNTKFGQEKSMQRNHWCEFPIFWGRIKCPHCIKLLCCPAKKNYHWKLKKLCLEHVSTHHIFIIIIFLQTHSLPTPEPAACPPRNFSFTQRMHNRLFSAFLSFLQWQWDFSYKFIINNLFSDYHHNKPHPHILWLGHDFVAIDFLGSEKITTCFSFFFLASKTLACFAEIAQQTRGKKCGGGSVFTPFFLSFQEVVQYFTRPKVNPENDCKKIKTFPTVPNFRVHFCAPPPQAAPPPWAKLLVILGEALFHWDTRYTVPNFEAQNLRSNWAGWAGVLHKSVPVESYSGAKWQWNTVR